MMTVIAGAATAAVAAGAALSQSVATASMADTLWGQVANALATQNDLRLQLNRCSENT